ncbi:rCG61195, partial [Rattus norvegicus]
MHAAAYRRPWAVGG